MAMMGDEDRVQEPWRLEAEGLRLFVHVQPGARREGIRGMHGRALRIAVRARAKEGEANQALVRWVAKVLGIPRKDVEIVRGGTSRRKELLIRGDAEALAGRLAEIVQG